MHRILIALIVLLAVAANLIVPVQAGTISTMTELEKVMSTNLKDVKQASTDVVQTMIMGPQGKMVLQGTIYYQVPDKMKMNMKTMMMGQEMLTTAINDGQFMWTETNIGQMKQVMKLDLKELKNMDSFKSIPGMKSENMSVDQVFYPLKNMKETYDLKWLGKEQVNDSDALAVEAVLTEKGIEHLKGMGQAGQAAIAMGSHQKLYFDPKTGFMKKLAALDSQGQEVMSMEFSNYNLKPEISPDFFTYTPPEGVKVVDMTPMMKGMLENMTKTAEQKETQKTETPKQTDQEQVSPDQKPAPSGNQPEQKQENAGD